MTAWDWIIVLVALAPWAPAILLGLFVGALMVWRSFYESRHIAAMRQRGRY
jgi:hypothetical protein